MSSPAPSTAGAHGRNTTGERRGAGSGVTRRVLTALVLIPLVVLATLGLPTPWFALLMGLLALLGAWEWAGLGGWVRPAERLGYCLGVALVLVGIHALLAAPSGVWLVLGAALVWWLVALAWVVRLQQGMAVPALDAAPVRLLAGWMVLGPTWGALTELHGAGGAGPALVLFLLVLVWCADSAAFFVGRRYGRRRLASRVSPGKSVEGVLGAMLAGALLAGAAAPLGGVPAPLPFVALSVLTVITSVLGDLTESAFKRRAGVKDSGSLIPGHGGVLDRIDSLTAAAPLFVLGYHWLGGMQ